MKEWISVSIIACSSNMLEAPTQPSHMARMIPRHPNRDNTFSPPIPCSRALLDPRGSIRQCRRERGSHFHPMTGIHSSSPRRLRPLSNLAWEHVTRPAEHCEEDDNPGPPRSTCPPSRFCERSTYSRIRGFFRIALVLPKDPSRSGSGALLVEFGAWRVSIPEHDTEDPQGQKTQMTRDPGTIGKQRPGLDLRRTRAGRCPALWTADQRRCLVTNVVPHHRRAVLEVLTESSASLTFAPGCSSSKPKHFCRRVGYGEPSFATNLPPRIKASSHG